MKLLNLLKIPLKLINVVGSSLLKAVFVDLPKNLRSHYTFAFNMQKRKQLQSDIKTNQKVILMEDRMKRLERLTYAIFEDPEYTKKDKGRLDLKELKKEVI